MPCAVDRHMWHNPFFLCCVTADPKMCFVYATDPGSFASWIIQQIHAEAPQKWLATASALWVTSSDGKRIEIREMSILLVQLAIENWHVSMSCTMALNKAKLQTAAELPNTAKHLGNHHCLQHLQGTISKMLLIVFIIDTIHTKICCVVPVFSDITFAVSISARGAWQVEEI